MSTQIKVSTLPIKLPETVNVKHIDYNKFVFDFNVPKKDSKVQTFFVL